MSTAVEVHAAEQPAGPLPAEVDIAVIGAGFSGLGAAISFREAGYGDFVLLELRSHRVRPDRGAGRA